MLSKKLLDALNKQINDEYYSSYIYQSMVAYFEDMKGHIPKSPSPQFKH